MPLYQRRGVDDIWLRRYNTTDAWVDIGTTATTWTVPKYQEWTSSTTVGNYPPFDVQGVWVQPLRQAYSMTDLSISNYTEAGLPAWVWTRTNSLSNFDVIRAKSWASWNDSYQSSADVREIRRQSLVERALWHADAGHSADATVLAQMTEAEKTNYDQKLAAAVERRIREQLEKQQAGERAERLLLTLLNAEQRADWQRARVVHVRGPSGAIYRLDGSILAGNITVLSPGHREVAQLCVHVVGSVPLADNVAAQLLAIQTQEDMVVGLANVHKGTLPEPLRELASAYRRRDLERAAA